jgi:DNA-binding IscR family transcriptional regulator
MSHHSASPRADRQPVVDKPNVLVHRIVGSDLSLAAKAVLLVILHYAWYGKRTCYASGRTIAADARLNERHVRRIIPDLEARGLIRVERHTGSTRSRYDITLGPCIHQVGQEVRLRLHEVGHSEHQGRTSEVHEVGHLVRQELGTRGDEESGFSPPDPEEISPAFRRFFSGLLPPAT